MDIRLLTFLFFDLFNIHDDEGVFSLPHVKDCGEEDEITHEQCDEIVRLAKWVLIT